MIEVPFLLFALLLPVVGQGERVEVFGVSLSVAGLWAMWNILVKGTLGVATTAIMAATTPVPALLHGLEHLRLPKVFVGIAAFMIRYLDVITGEMNRMRVARALARLRPPLALAGEGHGDICRRPVHPLATNEASASTWPWRRAGYDGIDAAPRRPLGSRRAMDGRDVPPRRRRPDRHDRVGGDVSTPALQVSGVTFAYPDGHGALFGVDLTIDEGERVALLGPNGAGKTTLVLHLNGILGGGAGEVRVDGLPVTKPNLREIRQRVGIVFQDPDDQLFMPTVHDDVAFGPANFGVRGAELEARVHEALAAVGMEAYADRAPHHLSFGQRRRVAAATVLAMRPHILVLDEPSSNLDPDGAP